MRLEYKLFIGFGVFVTVMLVAAGMFLNSQGIIGENNASTVAEVPQQDGLSGSVVEMDPNRAMAGAPCHQMGGRYMGDCQTREIAFEAFRYDWSEPTITVRTGEIVRLKATSRDVTHGIAIPDINFNLRIDPGRTSIGEFVAPAPGTYQYGCSVMCGPGHMDHRGKLVVVA